MTRWEPGSSERLQQAALELFDENGFEQTTVAEIAARAGVTERTFFRYFSDKREALFAGGERLEAMFVDAVAAAPTEDPLDQARAALTAAAGFFAHDRRDWARRRFLVLGANPALNERELLKMGSLSRALAAALNARGLGEPAATLLAQSAITVFQVAFERWVTDGEERSFVDLQHDTFAVLTGTLTRTLGAGVPVR
jgi:AcrR family transcriptional regulator